jgi:hypothetical protein
MGERHDEGGVWCKPNCPTHRAKERTPAERDTLRAEVVALTTERDAIAAQFDAYRARWNADQLPYKEMHDAAVARATAAEAERDALKKARPGCSPAPVVGLTEAEKLVVTNIKAGVYSLYTSQLLGIIDRLTQGPTR